MHKAMRILFHKTAEKPGHTPVPLQVLEHVLPGKVLAVVGLKDVDASSMLLGFETQVVENAMALFGRRSVRSAKVVRAAHLFEHLSVLENVYLPGLSLWKGRAEQIRRCRQLFARFGMRIDPLVSVDAYSDEERRLIELTRAYLQNPDVLLLYDTLSHLGFLSTECFLKILQAFREDGCRIVYFSTRWEEAIRMGDFFAILLCDKLQNMVYPAEEFRCNPRKMLYLLSGMDESGVGEDEDESVKALSSIYKSSELFVKNYELNNTLTYLAASINATMRAVCSRLYVRDEFGEIHTFSSDDGTEKYALTKPFLSCVFGGKDETFYIFKKDFARKGCFVSENDAQTLLGVRFEVGNRYAGFLEVLYDRYFIASERQFLILNTFCNEVSILLETSRLFSQSMLLRESHHRIKNNLQIIVGIIYNQKAYLRNHPENADYAAVLDSLICRIKNISMVHELLTHNANGGNILSLRGLIAEVLRLFSAGNVEIEQQIEEISIVYNKATALAMVLNELISNIFKHAFHDVEHPKIEISCAILHGTLLLKIHDNGVGLPPEFSPEKTDGVGMSIIKSLIRSLGASLEMCGDGGTTAMIRIPQANLTGEWIV